MAHAMGSATLKRRPGGRVDGDPISEARDIAVRTFTWMRLESGEEQPGLASSLEFMLTRYGEDVTLDDVAEASGASKYHFARRFRRLVGLTPMMFLARVRIAHAMDMLKDTNLAVLEIAGRVGYGDASAFTRAFGKIVGCQPTLYRRVGRA